MSRKAFSLVELIVALSIFAVLLSGLFYALGVELKFWHKLSGRCETNQIANMVIANVVRDIRGAKEILPGSTNSQLVLKMADETIEYSLAANKIKRKKNAYAAYLTGDGDLTVLRFAYFPTKVVEVSVGGFTTRAALRN